MDVSIIVQSFNRPEYLKGCVRFLWENVIDSCPDHTFQLIIADDGSNEETQEVIGTLDFHNYFYNAHKADGKGPGYTLNEAMKIAQGDYIMHVEDDFWCVHRMHDDELDELMHALELPGIELVRIRRILQDSSERYRLGEYIKMTELQTAVLRGGILGPFRTYLKHADGGPSYQYVGNPHLRKHGMTAAIGGYPEDKSIWQLENNMLGRFNDHGFRSGRFLKGWFSHMAQKDDETTRNMPDTFGGPLGR